MKLIVVAVAKKTVKERVRIERTRVHTCTHDFEVANNRMARCAIQPSGSILSCCRKGVSQCYLSDLSEGRLYIHMKYVLYPRMRNSFVSARTFSALRYRDKFSYNRTRERRSNRFCLTKARFLDNNPENLRFLIRGVSRNIALYPLFVLYSSIF